LGVGVVGGYQLFHLSFRKAPHLKQIMSRAAVKVATVRSVRGNNKGGLCGTTG
jgi:hypothetical protein